MPTARQTVPLGSGSALANGQLKISEEAQKHSYRLRGKSRTISSECVNWLATFAVSAHYSKGEILFAEGQTATGVFIVQAGRVKLFASSAGGKDFILGFAHPGEIRGLAGAVSGEPYEVWAEATEATHAGFVEREHFVDVLQRHGELAVQVARQLGKSYRLAIAGALMMGFSRSARQKMAIFLLNWCENNSPLHDVTIAQLTLTHEEIAQLIGSSRETVTRLLSMFRTTGLIQWNGGNLVLRYKAALESAATHATCDNKEWNNMER